MSACARLNRLNELVQRAVQPSTYAFALARSLAQALCQSLYPLCPPLSPPPHAPRSRPRLNHLSAQYPPMNAPVSKPIAVLLTCAHVADARILVNGHTNAHTFRTRASILTHT